MKIRLFNTLTRKKEDFQTEYDNTVRMYNCGPTVYKEAHIGNYRAYIFADLLRRLFELEGYNVTQVMNITDVGHLTNDEEDSGEDKVQQQADKEKLDPWELTKKYTQLFFNDLNLLKITPAHYYPKATEHIKEMIAITKKLLENGYAYEKEGNVYFEIAKFPKYGYLKRVNVDELEQGERAVIDPNKKNQFDFALWFSNSKHKNHIMKWDSPWGEGYPGWHIECSAMSMKYLTKVFSDDEPDFSKFKTIDIHTGGEDNIFPHHDCEIAQTEGATGKKFCNYWLHNKHLLVNNSKMSKSSGTLYLLKDLLDKGFSREAIRLSLMSTHYRQTINFTLDGLTAAQSQINRIQEVVDKLLLIEKKGDSMYQELSEEYRDLFRDALCDDLNISEALGITFKFINQINKLIIVDELDWIDAGFFLNYFMDFNKIFDIISFEKQIIPDEIIELAEKRKKSREEKNFVDADKFRDELLDRNYIIKDNSDGTYTLKKK